MLSLVLELIWGAILLLFHVAFELLKSTIIWLIPLSMRTKSLGGEVMLITGAGSGIGRGFACKFAALGCKVVLWDINSKGVAETAKLVREKGGKAWCYVCDVTDKEKVTETAQKVKNEVGDVTMLINNAGIVNGKKLLDLTESAVRRIMDVNSLAHVWTLQAFLPSMIAQNHGHIVTIASLMGETVTPGLCDYCMSKHAALALHECALREVRALGIDGVNFTLVNPYKIETGMFEGVNVRRAAELILPSLSPDYLVKKVVEAVQTNQSLLRAPAILHLVILLKTILPLNVWLLFEDFLGNEIAMNNFVGRTGKKSHSHGD